MNLYERAYIHYRYVFHRKWDSIYSRFCFIPKILNLDDCIDYIIKKHASVARFGDGELVSMFGEDLNFQKSTNAIQHALRRVCQSEDSRCLIGIPDVFENLERYIPVEQSFWKNHFYFHRSKWYSFLNQNRFYANTFISRFYSMEYDKKLAKERVCRLKKLWDDRNIVFIEGKDTKLGVGNDLFDNARSIHRIIAPSKNAFDKYDEILHSAQKVSMDDPLFFIALGPTATVLAYDLSQLGSQALDMGHIDIEYEWYRMGATSKVPIIGKFTNEAAILHLADSEVVGTLQDAEYEKQIIDVIL